MEELINMLHKREALVILAVCSLCFAMPFFSGCTNPISMNYHAKGVNGKPTPQCVGPYKSTSLSPSLNIGHIMDKTSPELTDWTKAQVIIKFTTDTGVVGSYDYNFSSKSPDGSNKDRVFLMYFLSHHEGDYYSQTFSTTAWTNFTLEVKFVSSDPTISAYRLFNGASNITGKMRINDTSINGSHKLSTDIILDRNDTALIIRNEGSSMTELAIDNDDWNLTMIGILNSGDKC